MACPLASVAGGGWRVAGAEAAGLPHPAESAPRVRPPSFICCLPHSLALTGHRW